MSLEEIEYDLSGPIKTRRISRLELLVQDNTVVKEVIELALKIENVPATLSEYRDRERYLESLLRALGNDVAKQSEKTQVLAVRSLLGSLYVNFHYFWAPTVRVLIEVLQQTKFQSRLLRTLLDHLKDTNNIIYDNATYNDLYTQEDRPDHILHRNFILQVMSRFVHFIETDSELFMDQFFHFANNELYSSPFIEKVTRDNLQKKDLEFNEDDDLLAIEDVEIENVIEQDETDPKKSLHKRFSKRSSTSKSMLRKQKSKETFLILAKLISNFQDITKIHRQHEFKVLALELLCCKDGNIQKAAFKCLLAYDNQHIKPYADKIFKLTDDKMMRSVMNIFSVDENESEQVLDQHRGQLIPILMRILFGRMRGTTGKKSTGRDKEVRKKMVMRFIAGCSAQEIVYFFELLFHPYCDYLSTPQDQLEDKLKKDLDINNYVPLNKLHAMIDSLCAYIDSVAHLKEETLPSVLKIIIIIIYHVIAPLEDPGILPKMSPRSIEGLKALRRECLNMVAKFFRMFEYYSFAQNEINFIFKYLVWNSTSGFIDKNYAIPTPFLELVNVFCSNRVYHQLLVKRNPTNPEEYLLHHIISLFVNEKTQRPVLKFIASMLADIIDPDRHSPRDSDEFVSEDNSKIEKPKQLDWKDECAIVPAYPKANYRLQDHIQFNHEILLRYIPDIFERLKKICQGIIDKKDEYKIENDELLILSTLSKYILDSSQSLLGAKLLLTTLSKQKKVELVLNTLRAVKVLLKQVEGKSDPIIIHLIADILSFQHNAEQRTELCELIQILAENDDQLVGASQAISLLNEMSADFMNSPDLAKWNEGFQISFKYFDELTVHHINQRDVVEHTLILLIHQVCFIVNNVDRYEFSTRENCIIFFEKLSDKIRLVDEVTNKDLLDKILEEIMLEKFIKKGLRETNDAVKHTYIGILRTLALQCHEKNKTLSEFYLFCDDNQEVDFWHNIRHIQLHNRSKALARLIVSEKISSISPKTLSAYFLPIASGFLFSRTYKSVASLSDNSIKLIGIICRQLNWKTYESTLSYYLDLLTKANATYQRTNIKLITEILKNFNYDITACEEAMQFEEENAKLEQRMKKRRGTSNSDNDSRVIETSVLKGKRLNPSTARMVYHSVTQKLIPRLNSCLHEMTRVEFEHDKNMSDYMPEKEEIKRIPMAYAIVQLLNLLPGRFVLFRDQLPALFLKLSSFLKSRNDDVRKAARLTLIKIMTFVGPAYIPDLLRILKQSLDKGFQIHVLNYTVHSVLDKLSLSYGDLDASVHELVNLSFQESFGRVAEDKEIAQILAKTFEAKKTKSYDTLLILASYISAEKLDYLMTSLKETLKNTSELKKVNKLSLCIQKVFNGLAKNEQFPLDKLFKFIQDIIEESIPSLKVSQKVDQAERPEIRCPEREDRYLITKDLPRDRIKSRINEKGNFHMMIENALRLLLHTFEANKLIISRKETIQRRLDGFIKLLTSCLKSSSPRCVTRSLKCIYFIASTKIDLPSFKTKSNSIVKKIFILLNLYNGVGMVQGDNFEMIGMCFKTVTLLLLHCEHVQLDGAQVRALLTYIEQDLHDTARQTTAFGTLNSLLHRKINSPELLDIMGKIADLLVTSDDESVRNLAIKIWQTYLLEYKHEGNKLNVHLTQFLRQLDYEFIDGRKAVLSLLDVVVSKFPENLLRDYHQQIFHLLALRLVNEESKEVRAIIGKSIGQLALRLPDQQAHTFNKCIIPWASGSNTDLKLLGIKLTSVYIESCRDMFTKDRVKKVLLILNETLESKNSKDKLSEVNVSIDVDNSNESEDIKKEVKETKLISNEDKLTYHSLRLFKRLLDGGLVDPVEHRYIDDLKKIWQNIAATKLNHWYIPVVITSCELYLIFIKGVNLSDALNVENPRTDDYVEWNAKRIVRTLCDKFIDLLERVDEAKQLIEYITESLVLLGQSVANSNASVTFENEYLNSFEGQNIIKYLLSMDDLPSDGFIQEHLPHNISEAKKCVNLMWLSVKVVNQARKEAALYRTSKTYRRRFVLQWTAAMGQELGVRRLIPYLVLFILTPVRELTDKGRGKASDDSSNQSTLTLCEDLLKFIKGMIGVEDFNKIYSKVQLHFTKRRLERKKKEAITKVKDPARGVKRKMKNLKSKNVKRRNTIRHGRN